VPRRPTPRYASFLATGALLGVAITVVVVLVRGPGGDIDTEKLFFYLGLLLAGIGALLGGIVAVVLEGRRAPTAASAREDRKPPPGP